MIGSTVAQRISCARLGRGPQPRERLAARTPCAPRRPARARSHRPLRGGEAPLTSPARAVWCYLLPHRVRYAAGALCLLAATCFSLGIPAVVKRAIEALQHDAAEAHIGG